MIAEIKCKEKRMLEAQLHTEKNDLKHSVRNFHQGRRPRVERKWWREVSLGCQIHLPTYWDSQSKPKATTIPHNDHPNQEESCISKWDNSTDNVNKKVLGVECLQLLIQDHGVLWTLLPQQNPSLAKHQAMTSADHRLTTRNERREGVRDNSAFLPWGTKKEVLAWTKIKKEEE